MASAARLSFSYCDMSSGYSRTGMESSFTGRFFLPFIWTWIVALGALDRLHVGAHHGSALSHADTFVDKCGSVHFLPWLSGSVSDPDPVAVRAIRIG